MFKINYTTTAKDGKITWHELPGEYPDHFSAQEAACNMSDNIPDCMTHVTHSTEVPTILEVLHLAEATIERLNRNNSADGTLAIIRAAAVREAEK